MHPLVSILIPAYNAEKWIAHTLESALAQSWPHKEIIVIDDGSKDRTRAVAETFALRGVRVVSQKNQGASAARNHALSLSKGDYIQWLDADDLLAVDKISRQMEIALACGSRRTLISCSWGHFIYRAQNAKFSPTSLWCDLSPLEWLLRKWEGNYFMANMSWLVSRELTEAAGPWNTGLSFDDDGEYFFRVIKASDGIKFMPDVRVFYRISGPGSLSSIGHSNKKFDSQFLSMKTQIAGLLAMSQDARTKATCVKFLQNWLIHFYPQRPDIISEAKSLAESLGGRLSVPRLPWYYGWIQPIFGWEAAKTVQLRYNHQKTRLLHSIEKFRYDFEMFFSRKGPYVPVE